jgi:hypothetical protein
MRWTSMPLVRKLQHSLRCVGLKPAVDRLYIDRWFVARIREQLACIDE